MEADDLVEIYLYQLVREFGVTLHGIYPTIAGETLNVATFLDIDDSVERALERLLGNGKLILETQDDEQIMLTKPLREMLIEPFQYFVRMSPTGAAEWEAAARPHWSIYYCQESDEHVMTIAAMNRSTIERLIANRVGWHYVPVLSTVRWQELRPWQATYWKTLDSGWRAEFEYEYCEMSVPPTEGEMRAVEDWRVMRRTGWYTPAWELPGWRWQMI